MKNTTDLSGLNVQNAHYIVLVLSITYCSKRALQPNRLLHPSSASPTRENRTWLAPGSSISYIDRDKGAGIARLPLGDTTCPILATVDQWGPYWAPHSANPYRTSRLMMSATALSITGIATLNQGAGSYLWRSAPPTPAISKTRKEQHETA
jgi:hypothetical protein